MYTPPLTCSEYNFVLDNPKVRLGSSPSYSSVLLALLNVSLNDILFLSFGHLIVFPPETFL
jgi:hypothetical protein